MSKDRPPSFQFYPRDYLTDPKVVAMTPAERGAYVHLLCAAWLADEIGYLPLENTTLRGLSGCGREWSRLSKRVLDAFDHDIRPGWIVQKRMVEERIEQERRYGAASEGGKKTWEGVGDEERKRRAVAAAQARWGMKDG